MFLTDWGLQGVPKPPPLKKKKKKKLGRILFKRKALLVTDSFFFFEFIYTWWLHYSPSPTAGQRAVAAAGAEEVNASLKAFSVVLSTAHEHYISTPQQNVPAGKWILLLVKKKKKNLHLETVIFMPFFPP